MTVDITNAQLGDKLTLEVEFARHGDEHTVVVAHGHDGGWVQFPVPISAITAHNPPAWADNEKENAA